MDDLTIAENCMHPDSSQLQVILDSFSQWTENDSKVPKYGKRKSGRQQALFLKYTQSLLGDLNDMLDQLMIQAIFSNCTVD